MKRIIYSVVPILSLLSLIACSQSNNFSVQEFLDQAMQETLELNTYYGEYEITLGDESVAVVKQWEKNGKVRTEMNEVNKDEILYINDGKVLTSYNKSSNSGTTLVYNEDNPENLMQTSLKEQSLRTLEMIKDTHDITIEQDKNIAGRDTYHLIAKKKKDADTIISDIEIWVDKKTWMTLKYITISEDTHLTMTYTKFEPNAQIDDLLFVADLPVDTKMQEERIFPNNQITVE